MQNKLDMPIKRIFLISLIIGILIAFVYEPLYFIISDFFQKKINVSPWQIASSTLLVFFISDFQFIL